MTANPQTNRFKRSFKPTRYVRAGETCSLKLHFTGAVREVVGYLDKLASNNRERFVFAGVDDIVVHCGRYKGKGYEKRIIEYVLQYLRARSIIGPPVTRKIKVGNYLEERRGFIVTSHDSLSILTGTTCEFVGHPNATGTSKVRGDRAVWWSPDGDEKDPTEPTTKDTILAVKILCV